MKPFGIFAMGWFLASTGLVFSQGSHNDYDENAANVQVDHALLEGLEFRDVGFTRGGRSTAAVGVPEQPLVYYLAGPAAACSRPPMPATTGKT